MKRMILLLGLFLAATPAMAQGMLWNLEGDGGYLGVQLRDVTAQDVTDWRLPSETGAVVTEVVADSPAAEAGLMADDVVVDVAGLPVLSARHFQRVIGDNPPDRNLTLTIYRSGRQQTVAVQLGERPGMVRTPRRGFEVRPFQGGSPPEFRFKGPGPNIEIFGDRPRLGIEGHALSRDLAQALKLGVDQGILVLSVSPDSPAERAGLKVGDVIVKAAGSAIKDLDQLRDALEGKSVDLEIRRGSQKLNLTAELEEKDSPDRVKL